MDWMVIQLIRSNIFISSLQNECEVLGAAARYKLRNVVSPQTRKKIILIIYMNRIEAEKAAAVMKEGWEKRKARSAEGKVIDERVHERFRCSC